jgi:polyisoprenoid-binding protein YceI
MRLRGLAAGFALLVAPAPAAHAVDWHIDPAASSAQFRVRLLAILPMSGSFDAVHGTVAFDPDTREVLVDAELDSGAVRMRNASHAAWARSAEFFDATNHPRIRFRSAPFAQDLLRDGGRIEGELSLRGVTRPVGFRIEAGTCDPAQDRRCTLEVSGQVRRSDFGMGARAATVSDWVTLRLRVEAGID